MTYMYWRLQNFCYKLFEKLQHKFQAKANQKGQIYLLHNHLSGGDIKNVVICDLRYSGYVN